MAWAAESRCPGSLLLLPGFAVRSFLPTITRRSPHAKSSLKPLFFTLKGRVALLWPANDRGWNFVRATPRRAIRIAWE